VPALIAEPENAPLTSDVSGLSAVDLEKRVAGDSMDSDARYALARKYHTRGQFDRAISLYQETVRLDPMNANAQNDLGVALWARGKRAEAESAFRRAIALDQFLFPAHINLGLLLRALNRAVEASQEFFRARQNARGEAETRMAEAASSGGKIDPLLSK
jgi:Flp pilus assembly protein TadD